MMALKNIVLVCALLAPAFSAFAGPSAGSGRDVLEAQLVSAKDDALSVINGISRTWGNTVCGNLLESRQKLLENLEIQLSLTPNDAPSLKRGDAYVMMTGASKKVTDEAAKKLVRRVSIVVDRGQLTKRSGSEQERHDYAGLIAGFVLSDNELNYDVSKCVIDFLRERDAIRKAASPNVAQPDAGAAR